MIQSRHTRPKAAAAKRDKHPPDGGFEPDVDEQIEAYQQHLIASRDGVDLDELSDDRDESDEPESDGRYVNDDFEDDEDDEDGEDEDDEDAGDDDEAARYPWRRR